MNDLRKAAQQALEILDWMEAISPNKPAHDALIVLRAALAQPEPVCDKDPRGCWNVRCQLGKVCKNTTPQRQPLTDALTRAVSQCNAWWVAEITEIINDNTDGDGICCADDLLAAIRAIEREHEIGV